MTVAVTIACAAALAACGNAVGKSGAPASHATVIHLGAADTNNAQLLNFVSNLEGQSKHTLHVQVDEKTYFSETPGGELKLAGDLAAGKVDVGYLPSRDWAQAGAAGFAALQAPGLLTTTSEEIQLAENPIAAQLLGGLSANGVVGLALVPDEPRRLITREPVLTPGDLKGKQIRIGDNAHTAAMIGALGGTAVQGITAGQTKDKLLKSELDGVETGPTPASQNTYETPAPYLTSFGLIPKFEVLAVNQAFWHKLSSADQQLVQAAATATVTRAAVDVPTREADQLKVLCAGGAVIVRPNSADLKSIYTAAAKARPTGGPDQALIAQILKAVGYTEPQPDAAPVPASCPVASSAAAAERKHLAVTAPTGSNTASNPKLVGTYKIDVTAKDWQDGGVRGTDWTSGITFVWKLSPDGTMYETQKPDFPDQGPQHGTWQAKGNRIVFTYGGPGSAGDDYVQTVTWSLFKGVLSLKPISVGDQPSEVIYSVPWRKIA